ncbi:type III PLP-dependent enzyme [Pseudoalteromonas fenneropenaei]|uniref:Type III PLP-dependent enzyme n=1 Tax=Pseudoalteromonas fenneropenaei TaxID=1737459 RepID=A0ABV7CG65_9GAMM
MELSALHANQPDYRKLVAQYGSPLLVLDGDAVRKQFLSLQQALPGVALHYALKPLPHEAVVAVLKELDGYFDLATNGEVDLVRDVGVDPERCIHSHPIKRDSDIRYALEYGCTTFVVDNIVELQKFVAYKHDTKLLLRVSFRNPDTKIDLSKKFGCRQEEALGLLKEAQALGLNVIGLSFHVGSQAVNPMRHSNAIAACREIIENAKQAGIHLSTLDIGGGFPVSYDNKAFDIVEYCTPIRAELAKLPSNIRVLAEPGRYICAPAVTAISSVMGIAERGDQTWYYLDDGVYGSYSGQIYDHMVYPLSFPYAAGEPKLSVLSGPTCDSIDVIREDIMLPPLAVGELVIGHVMGAYTWASATEFNFFRKANFVVVNGPEGCKAEVAA